MNNQYEPTKDIRDASRRKWSHDSESFDAINCGSLLRMADATELMAKNHAALVAGAKYEKDRRERAEARCDRQARAIAALRGHLRRAKRAIAENPWRQVKK